jgi:hypothetical protein
MQGEAMRGVRRRMGIQHIDLAAYIDAGLRTERSHVPRRGAPAGEGRAAEEGVDLDAERLRAQRQILRSVLGGLEACADADTRALLEAAGRSAYLDSIAQAKHASPPATAQRILGGITGYVYGAFRLAHPGASPEDFDRFAFDVLRGLERGFGEARGLSDGLAALTLELAAGIERSETLVREGLDVFFSDERRRIEGARGAD